MSQKANLSALSTLHHHLAFLWNSYLESCCSILLGWLLLLCVCVCVCVCVFSVVILAFVKSEGKSSEKPSESEPNSPNENTSLLTDKNSSLEGSLRERVVSIVKDHINNWLLMATVCDVPLVELSSPV